LVWTFICSARWILPLILQNLYRQSPAAGSNFMEGVGRPIRIDCPGRPWPLGLIRDHGAIGTMAFFRDRSHDRLGASRRMSGAAIHTRISRIHSKCFKSYAVWCSARWPRCFVLLLAVETVREKRA
jgi:hypothetical protein